MKNTLLRSVAAGAVLVGSSLAIPAVAFAQDTTTTPPPAGGTETKPATPPAAPAPDTTKPAESGADKTKAPADETAAKPGEGEEIMSEQEDTQVLASTYIGQSVYNAKDESIGDISDLVFDKKGGIQAAVIGVGGFLGIGQKDVAVKFDRIEIQREPDSADVKLVTDMTADQLKQAPAFKNLQTKMNEQNANKPAAGGTTGGGMTGTGGGMTGGGMGTGGATGTGTAPAQ